MKKYLLISGLVFLILLVNVFADTINIDFYSPINGKIYNTTKILLNFSVQGDNNVSFVGYSVDNGSFTYFGPYNTPVVNFSQILTLEEGRHIIEIFMNSSIDNTKVTKSRNFIIDITPPNITVYLPNGSYNRNESLPLNYTVNDSLSGIDTCWFSVDNGSNIIIANCQNTTFNVSGDGNHSLTLYANDSAGNVNNQTVYFLVDVTPPEVNVTSPKNDSWYHGIVNITINATDSFSGVARVVIDYDVFYYRNGTFLVNASLNATNQSGLWTGQINTSAFPDNTSIIINATAWDKAGNNASVSEPLIIFVDNSPPLILDVNINKTALLPNETIYINVSVSENASEIISCFAYLYKDNNEIDADPNSTKNENLGIDCEDNFHLPENLSDGNYSLRIRVRNNATLTTWNNDTILIIDNTTPSVSFVPPTPSSGSKQTQKTVIINISYSDANPDTLWLNFSGNVYYVTNLSSSGWINWTLTLSDGSYSYYACLNDSAGNQNCTENRTLEIYTPKSTGTGGGGYYTTSYSGGGISVCSASISCSNWSECINGTQTRTCNKTLDDCTKITYNETRACTLPSEEVRICEENERRCVNGSFQKCEGNEWVTVYTCESGVCLNNSECLPKRETVRVTGHVIFQDPSLLAALLGLLLIIIGLLYRRHKRLSISY